MKKLAIALLSVSSLISGASAFAQLPTQPYLFGLWEGTMTVVQPGGDGPMLPPFDGASQSQFRLDIRDTNLVMYFPTGPDEWTPVGEGADLRLNEQGRSAIVMAGMRVDPFTETWVINVVRWDEENITVYLSRVMSPNPDGTPATRIGALGQMKRIEQ